MFMSTAPTACLLIIGDEILSGRTQDANLKFIGNRMAEMGIRLLEARVVPDDPDAIVEALNMCRVRYTYIFTTGGIGPTPAAEGGATLAAAPRWIPKAFSRPKATAGITFGLFKAPTYSFLKQPGRKGQFFGQVLGQIFGQDSGQTEQQKQ